jgi:hypothetical protein
MKYDVLHVKDGKLLHDSSLALIRGFENPKHLTNIFRTFQTIKSNFIIYLFGAIHNP